MNRHHTKPTYQRGFLLLVVIGILAVLLTVCVGFLSYTRGEVMSVQAQRNKGDTIDAMRSALDYTLANITHDLMDSSDNMDPSQHCEFTINPGGGTGGKGWWMRPFQKGMCKFLPGNPWGAGASGWGFPLQPATQPGAETSWAYLPADFFPGGGVRGRFMVQVMDANSCININDWNEDCNPSQCQMAHMILDAYGIQNLENNRWYRDFGNGNWGYLPTVPMRYQEGWRVASHTDRYMAWPDWTGNRTGTTVSFNWVTHNNSWMSLYGPVFSCMQPTTQSDAMPLYQTVTVQNYLGSAYYCTNDPSSDPGQYDRSGNGMLSGRYGAGNPQSAGYLPWAFNGFVTKAGTDPDTGRSPINVNTCFNSGEYLPVNFWDNPPTYTMEGVWNVESLRRIIKVGNFWTGTVWKNAQTDWNNGTPAGSGAGQSMTPQEKMIVETLKLKLAYQYQETLCRYFTGTYGPNNGNTYWAQKFQPFSTTVIKTYPATYPGAIPLPSNCCTVTDYSAPRFPTDLPKFRKNVRADLLNALTASYTNSSFVAGTMPSRPAGQYDASYTDGTVNFDANGNPEIAQGKLDMRTACACYDNMIPGKPADMAESAGGFKGCTVYGTGDPLYELYVLQVARQEDMDDPYEIDPSVIGMTQDPAATRTALGATPAGGPPYGGGSPNAPWPLSQWPGPAQNNIYSRWVDNPMLSAVTYFNGNSFPNSNAEVPIYDSGGVGSAQAQTLLPKGNDICSKHALDAGWPGNASSGPPGFDSSLSNLSGAPVPTGPWLDSGNIKDRSVQKQNDVPWRQMCFSPDSFSTELTTTATTFVMIINAQLVDGQTVNANPTNPDLHTDLCWNQWGLVVEIAPDIMAEPSAADPAVGTIFPVASGSLPPSFTSNGVSPNNQFWQWYKNEMPRKTKTYQGTLPMTDSNWADDSWLDDSCPTLVSKNQGNTAQYFCPFGRTDNQCRMKNGKWDIGNIGGGWNPALPGGAADLENSTATINRDWKRSTNPLLEATTGCDIHQVPPAGAANGRGADGVYDGPGAPNKYQTKKRIIIRQIWCVNEGIEL
jgi:hypothetical protein